MWLVAVVLGGSRKLMLPLKDVSVPVHTNIPSLGLEIPVTTFALKYT